MRMVADGRGCAYRRQASRLTASPPRGRTRGASVVALPAGAHSGESEHRFRRFRGYCDMARLILALDNWSESFHQPHKAA